jgi:predicted transcriptional regulator
MKLRKETKEVTYMKQVLENLALIHLIDFAKNNNLDIAGTHLVKNGRGFKYSLINNVGSNVVTVTFYKTKVPTYQF